MSSSSHRLLWLLVEWVDEREVFPSYGVVNVGSVIGNDTDLRPGKMVVIQGKQRSGARRGQILRISDEKNHVKEHKLLLERQDHQVKNVLSLCMRTIKEMKSDPIYFGSMGASQPVSIAGASSSSSMTQIVANNGLSSSSDDDSESEEEPESTRNFKVQNYVKQKKQDKHLNESCYQNVNRSKQSVRKSSLRRSDVATAPANTKMKGAPTKQVHTQGTQTDDEVNPPLQEKLEQMEVVLTHLYTNFLTLVQKLHIFPVNNGETEDDLGAINNEYDQMGAEDANLDAQVGNNFCNDEAESARKPNVRALQVRRVSAHTTNDVVEPALQPESDQMNMVAIGSGNATVPARLMNEINWDSYTTATRQLLQAIFPRKILATHSLTGKKSPAFANKAPKKCLDPNLVSDIVDTVSARCGVPKNIVRSTITTKCTDEAKLFRNRQLGRNSHQGINLVNQENVPPSPLSSYESSSPTPTRDVKPFS